MELYKLRLLLKEMGIPWVVNRSIYEAKKRTGFLELKAHLYPLKPVLPDSRGLTAREFVGSYFGRFFVPNVSTYAKQWSRFLSEKDKNNIINIAGMVESGIIRCFSAWNGDYGKPYQWQKEPLTGRKVPFDRHWSRIQELSAGVDIKLVWEFSRFPQVYYLMRAYALTGDERYARVFWEQFESWVNNNPYQVGPNWFCGQEAAIRVMAWVFGLFTFLGSPHTTVERIKQLVISIHAHGVRIAQNINYAIKLVRNNHAISESAGLFTIGVLFPFLREAKRWQELGYRYLVEEGLRQIYVDGSYLQHSFNYQRMVVQLYNWCLRLGKVNDIVFDKRLIQRLKKCVVFLYQMQDTFTGRLPNYGNNDGALIFPVTSCDFLDYRPQLNTLHYLLNRTRLYSEGKHEEELFWFCGQEALDVEVCAMKKESASFDVGGYYVIRSKKGLGYIRCASYQDRPAQADILHFDLWWNGHNVLCDAGTFLYNCELKWNEYFKGTRSHNTVVVDGRDQMIKLGHFLWCDWIVSKPIEFGQINSCQYFKGEHYGYGKLGVVHRRTIFNFGELWLVVDDLFGQSQQAHHFEQHWLLGNFEWTWDKSYPNCINLLIERTVYCLKFFKTPVLSINVMQGEENRTVRGWRSRYYGLKEPVPSVVCEVNSEVPYRFVSAFYPSTDLESIQLNYNLIVFKMVGEKEQQLIIDPVFRNK